MSSLILEVGLSFIKLKRKLSYSTNNSEFRSMVQNREIEA